MDTTAFNIEFMQDGVSQIAEVRPCCKEDNIVDHAIWINGKLEFTITKNLDNKEQWVIGMKNADDIIDDDTVQRIGTEIDKVKRDR